MSDTLKLFESIQNNLNGDIKKDALALKAEAKYYDYVSKEAITNSIKKTLQKYINLVKEADIRHFRVHWRIESNSIEFGYTGQKYIYYSDDKDKVIKIFKETVSTMDIYKSIFQLVFEDNNIQQKVEGFNNSYFGRYYKLSNLPFTLDNDEDSYENKTSRI